MYTLGPAPTSTLRTIPFTIPTSAWTESNGIYTATFASAYITETSKEMCTFDESLRNRAKRDINISKTSGGGSITLTTSALPTGAISGTIFTIDADDGKVCMVIEDTVLPIANGGTGANTLAEAKENLGISAISRRLIDNYGNTDDIFRFATDGNGKYGYVKEVGGADTFFPFRGDLTSFKLLRFGSSSDSGGSNTFTGLAGLEDCYLILHSGSTGSGYVNGRVALQSYSGCTLELIQANTEEGPTNGRYNASRLYKMTNLTDSITITTGSDSYGTSNKLIVQMS